MEGPITHGEHSLRRGVADITRSTDTVSWPQKESRHLGSQCCPGWGLLSNTALGQGLPWALQVSPSAKPGHPPGEETLQSPPCSHKRRQWQHPSSAQAELSTPRGQKTGHQPWSHFTACGLTHALHTAGVFDGLPGRLTLVVGLTSFVRWFHPGLPRNQQSPCSQGSLQSAQGLLLRGGVRGFASTLYTFLYILHFLQRPPIRVIIRETA